MKSEYDAIGLPFDPPGVRVSRLKELIKVIKSYLPKSYNLFLASFTAWMVKVLITSRSRCRDDKQQKAKDLFADFPLPAKTLLSLPFTLVSREDEIADELEVYREQHGITYYIVLDKDMEVFAPVVARMAGK